MIFQFNSVLFIASQSDGNGNSIEITGTMRYVQQFTDMTRYVKS